MFKKRISRLHWKLFLPLIGLLWLIIGITIFYFVSNERIRQKESLENRLLNVNNTVIDAYNRGFDLKSTVEFIRLYTSDTTLDPLRITVYNDDGTMIADNPATTISLYDSNGKMYPELEELWHTSGNATVHDMAYNDTKSMISSKTSPDGKVHSFAALPYEGEVLDLLSIDPMVWIVVVLLGLLSSTMAYLGVRAICRNVYALRDFAQAMASDQLPADDDLWHFSKDELGDVSRNLVRLYRDKIHAEKEKMHHEHQIGINVSHELNTPVSIIKGYIDSVLRDGDMPEDVKRKFLIRAQQNIDRLANLVSDMRMVLKLDEQEDEVAMSKVNVNQLAARIGEDIRQSHIVNSMDFKCDVPENCCVLAHEPLLTNALLNLIYNSVNHSGGSCMYMRWLRKESGLHIFTFEDDGTGVGEEHIGRLFDMFYRADSGRSRKSGGAGLGLSLVRRIITAMGGSIEVENVSAGGLRFTFSLRAAG